jgi:hypothetical protein
MVFAKKKYPDDWEEKVRYASREYFKNDGKWDDKKVEQKIKSWNQTESGYHLSRWSYNSKVYGRCLL